MRHPDVPEALRGTYAGLAHPAMIEALPCWASRPSSSCPCTSSCTTAPLVELGLRNYWGYNSIGFFAPHGEYAARATAAARCGVQGHGEALHEAASR
jgi:isoamylase